MNAPVSDERAQGGAAMRRAAELPRRATRALRRRLRRGPAALPAATGDDALWARMDALDAEFRRMVALVRHDANTGILELTNTTDDLATTGLDRARAEAMNARIAGVGAHAAALEERIAELQGRLEHADARFEAFDGFVRQWVTEALEAMRVHLEAHGNEAVDLGIGRIEQRVRRLERAARAAGLAGAPATPHPSPADSPDEGAPRSPTVGAATPTSAGLDFSYETFEDRLRGSRDWVAHLQADYVERIGALPHPELPVLDIGCGRGEFLRLLDGAGIAARGIDLSESFVGDCTDLGLDVIVGDGIAHLEGLPAASLRAVTAFHVVEHLSVEQQLRLLAATLRVLAPGGAVILETPNPENLSVGAHTFWLDPTHLRPLPPLLLEFQVTESGFEEVEILRLHADPPLFDAPEAAGDLEAGLARLNTLLAGPMDYAVVGRRPLAD